MFDRKGGGGEKRFMAQSPSFFAAANNIHQRVGQRKWSWETMNVASSD
jgi:hypothetical protein